MLTTKLRPEGPKNGDRPLPPLSQGLNDRFYAKYIVFNYLRSAYQMYHLQRIFNGAETFIFQTTPLPVHVKPYKTHTRFSFKSSNCAERFSWSADRNVSTLSEVNRISGGSEILRHSISLNTRATSSANEVLNRKHRFFPASAPATCLYLEL